ncbi:MAG: Gfo/Idh/MocA family oxidoreductase, partial [Acidobacteriota bacterium]|nr:Gfo/Idh/MocA family oxidoreductase [Acidobacteriota bacterium]
MKEAKASRRKFLNASIIAAAGAAVMSALPEKAVGANERLEVEPGGGNRTKVIRADTPRIRISAIGLNHGHIYGQVGAVLRGGGELVSFFAKEPDLVAAFSKRFPQAKLARSADEILEDKSIQLIVSASIPDERAPLGIQAMRHGKDFMADKPGITSLEQLAEVRRVQQQTRRIYSIMYSERFENPATVKAGELIKTGVIGRVIQTIGLGPHRENPKSRPAWFFDRERYGGIICDIGSHQVDQFLFFTGSTEAEVIASQVSNIHHPQHPKFEDFGDVTLRGDRGTGYIRVDWFTPDGLSTWGDGRLTILGTDGFIEIRKNINIAGRPGANHLFLADQKGTHYFDCSKEHLPYGEQLVSDIVNRTETAMSQTHCFLATELALKAQKQA